MPSSSSGYIPLSYTEAPRRYASSARSQLSSNPRASWSIGGLLFLTLLLFATSSPFSPSEPSYSSPLPTSKAHRLLYYAHESESEEGTCSFLDPTLGFSEEELSLMERIPSAKADPVGMYEGEGAEGGVHPLFGLIKMGETKFRGLVEKRSESLEEAVVEYRKRYGRSPPKGFDKWWEYAQENKILLPDEYDSIESSLAPFRAYRKEDIKERHEVASRIRDTVLLTVKDGVGYVEYTPGLSPNDYWTHRRTDSQLALLTPIAHHLPNLSLAFSMKDEPQLMLSSAAHTNLLSHASSNTHLPPTPYSPPRMSSFPWPHSCPPDSPLRLGIPSYALTSPTRFIANHRQAQDPCLHPGISEGHGFLLDQKGEWTSPRPQFGGEESLVPVLAMSKTERNADLLGVPFDEGDFGSDDSGKKIDWKEKIAKLYWRGHSTGMVKSKTHGLHWRLSHRLRLHHTLHPSDSLHLPLVPFLLSSPQTSVSSTQHLSHITRLPAVDLVKWGYDVSLTGHAIQCDEGDGTCDEMDRLVDFAKEDGKDVGAGFKFLFDVDGNAWTSRFRRLLLTESVILKSTIFPEWNTDILPEYFAYIPIKMDFTDIPSVLAFFKGDPVTTSSSSSSTTLVRDEVARRIAHNGRCWVQRTWRKEDMVAYMFRFYLEWARIQGEEGDL